MTLKNQTKSIIGISFLVTVCLIMMIALNANRFMKNMSDNNSRLYDAFRISELMKSFRSNITALGNKEQSYIVTGDAKFLEEYKVKEMETKVYLQSMEKYFVDKPEEPLFRQLKLLTYKKLMQAKDLSQAMPGIPQMPEEEGNRNESAETLDKINETIDLINESLGETSKGLINNSISYVQSSRNWGLLEVGIGIFATLIAVVILFRDINVRNRLETELRIAKKRADDHAMMKEQFTANMSHEIRTPMNAILGFADLLHKTKLDHTQEEYLSAIRNSSANLLHIINDILDFSKIEAGMLHIEKIPFSISEVIGSLRLIFEEKAREKKLAFHVQADARVPALVIGDPTRLTQILVNLLNNAVKFTQQGSVSLSLDIRELSRDQVKLLFRVKDTGVGIPADKQSGVFERFNQGNPETTRKYGGTGLGLAIVKNLLEMQQGEIRFLSTEGIGTEFSVEIAYAVADGEEVQQKPGSQDKYLNMAEKGSWKILLAEDNLLNQKLTTTLLEGFGLEADVAEHGGLVLEKLKSHRYDLILMDIQMPVLDGYHTTRKIREELMLDLPVIAMTAHSMEGEREKCLSYGMDDYISKPFKEAELYAVVFKYLGAGTGKPLSPVQGPSLTPVPDLSSLYEMTKGNKVFMREVIEIFVAQNPSDLQEFSSAIATANYEAIHTVTHRMKTSVGFIGMTGSLQVLSEIEQLGKKGSGMEEIRQKFNLIKTACEAAVQELTKILKSQEWS